MEKMHENVHAFMQILNIKNMHVSMQIFYLAPTITPPPPLHHNCKGSILQ